MECTRFEELLFERLEGSLDEARSEELTAHATACDRCGDLENLLTSPAQAGTGGAVVPDDLAESVLALTSAREPLQRALRQLDLDLPAMASMVPDDDFVADVMAATTVADKQRFWYRAREFWHGLAQRPRFALEGAYLGAVTVVLLVGMPWSPFADMREQVLTELRGQDSIVRTTLAEGTSRIGRISTVTWSRASEIMSGEVELPELALHPTIARPLAAWRDRVAGWFAAVWTSVFKPTFDWIVGPWTTNAGDLSSDAPAPPELSDEDNNEHPTRRSA